MKIRIWHQSFCDLTMLPTYRRTLESHAQAVADEETEIVVHGLRPDTYGDGSISHIRFIEQPYFHLLNKLQIIDNALEAERQGFDGMAIGCFFDPGLRETRSLVDIPVLGLCESSLSITCSLGRKFSIITLCEGQSTSYRDIIDHYGLSSRLASVVTMIPPLDEHVLEESFHESEEIAKSFEEACRKAISDGAEVIIPADGVLNEFLYLAKLEEVDGITVLDAIGCLLKRTELFVRLRRLMGLHVSRHRYYAPPEKGLLQQVRRFYHLEDR